MIVVCWVVWMCDCVIVLVGCARASARDGFAARRRGDEVMR